MLNAARSPTFYEFDSSDLLQLYKEMAANDEEPVVIYHSRTDISYASEPNAHYVLVSTRLPDTAEIGRASCRATGSRPARNAHRHLLRVRAECALRAGLDPVARHG